MAVSSCFSVCHHGNIPIKSMIHPRPPPTPNKIGNISFLSRYPGEAWQETRAYTAAQWRVLRLKKSSTSYPRLIKWTFIICWALRTDTFEHQNALPSLSWINAETTQTNTLQGAASTVAIRPGVAGIFRISRDGPGVRAGSWELAVTLPPADNTYWAP